MSDVVSIDTETFWSKKLKYTIRTTLPELYVRHHLFDCYMVSACDGLNAWAGHPRDFNWSALNGKVLISHNARFDQAVIWRLVELGLIPDFKPSAWYCSASMTAYICGRRALADAIDHLYSTKLSKEVRNDSVGKHWPQDFTAEEQTAMLTYARNDAYWTWKLWNEHASKWPEYERNIANWHIQRGREGVQINRELLNNYIVWTHACKMTTQALLPWLEDTWDEDESFTDEVLNGRAPKPTSTKCIAEHCRRMGIPCPPVKEHEGEEAFQEWELEYGPRHPWIAALSSWRSVNKLLKTFEKMKERISPEGRMPFGQRYCGTDTGRVAGEGQVNLFNQRKQAVLIDECNLMEADDIRVNAAHNEKQKTGVWPSWVKHAIDFRNLIIAPPGTQLLTSDLSQIEPRCAAYIAGDMDFLKLAAEMPSERGGLYAAHAIKTMGWDPARNLKKEEPKKYGLAKMRVLSLGYGASWKKLIIMARKESGVDLTVGDPETIEETNQYTGITKTVSGYGAQAKSVVKDYRATNQPIVMTWRSLEDGMRRSIGSDFIITLPSGRQLRFEKVRSDTRVEQDDEGKPYLKTVYTAEVDGKRKIIYGSKLFAMTCQSFARDIFYAAVLRLESAGFCVRLGVYDECVIELQPEQRPEDITQAMITTPDWLPGFPLATDTKILPCYSK